ncbi:hypothetical protein M231_06817 [Tremella mesenterica]|uniref:Large ribosomal subunit protein uL29m n=1 Tax=Tremella mesenterica TaxID=5217 RepID=A0A4Q1BCU5_TREME|nr:hypothetical protein M231_06817 [Tremella mesenterica]
MFRPNLRRTFHSIPSLLHLKLIQHSMYHPKAFLSYPTIMQSLSSRSTHSGNRQIPHPGIGGGSTTTTSPTIHGHHIPENHLPISGGEGVMIDLHPSHPSSSSSSPSSSSSSISSSPSSSSPSSWNSSPPATNSTGSSNSTDNSQTPNASSSGNGNGSNGGTKPLIMTSTENDPTKPDESPPIAHRPKFTPKGRPILIRPPRIHPVTLPSGIQEPPVYPPPPEWVEMEKEEIGDKKPHPLWSFFRVPLSARIELPQGLEGPVDMGSLEVVESDKEAQLRSGRSWTANELRQMSFADLHTLWYILLRERNLLATQREEFRRLRVVHEGRELLRVRGFRCRKSMARIKYVLNERRLGLEAATRQERMYVEGETSV